jgi:hypothetical protein
VSDFDLSAKSAVATQIEKCSPLGEQLPADFANKIEIGALGSVWKRRDD